MATIKAFTDLEQSKKLAEILPIESADMIWILSNPDLPMIKAIAYKDSEKSKYYETLPAWSLAALMDVLERGVLFKTPQGWVCQAYVLGRLETIKSNYYSNPVDACYELILNLKTL